MLITNTLHIYNILDNYKHYTPQKGYPHPPYISQKARV